MISVYHNGEIRITRPDNMSFARWEELLRLTEEGLLTCKSQTRPNADGTATVLEIICTPSQPQE